MRAIVEERHYETEDEDELRRRERIKVLVEIRSEGDACFCELDNDRGEWCHSKRVCS